MKEILTIGILFIALSIIGDYFLRKKMNISKGESLMSNRAKRFQTFGVVLITACYFIMIPTFLIKYENINIGFLIFPFMIAIGLFRAFMEWRFNRAAKKWAMEIYSFVMLTLLLVVLLVLGIM